MRFKYGCYKYMNLNQLTVVILDKSPVDEETKVITIAVIPDETVPLENGYYNGAHVLLSFNKKVGIDRNYDQAEMDTDPDKDDM